MQVGAVGGMSYFTPYIYNTNFINRASMNKIAAVGDDVTAAKTDFSALTQETTNPLKRGESLDFAGILDMQMQMSRLNADRLMKSPEEVVEATQAAGIAENEVAQTAEAVSAVETSEGAAQSSMSDFARDMVAYQPFEAYV